MSTLGVLFSTGSPVEVGGKMLSIKGRTIGDYAEICSRIEWLRGDPLRRLRRIASLLRHEERVSAVAKMLETLRHGPMETTGTDMCQWLSTLEGRVFSFWQAARDNGVSYEWCLEKYFQESEKQGEEWEYKLKWAIESASGDSETEGLWEVLEARGPGEESLNERPFVKTIAIFTHKPFSYSYQELSKMTFWQLRFLTKKHGDRFDDLANELAAKEMIGDNVYLTRKQILGAYNRRYNEMAANLVSGNSLLFTGEIDADIGS